MYTDLVSVHDAELGTEDKDMEQKLINEGNSSCPAVREHQLT